MNDTKTQRESDLESIQTQMRTAMISCGHTKGRLIIGGNIRLYINMGIGNSYFVADRMEDGYLRFAFFQNNIKQPSFNAPVECFNREWDEFVEHARQLATQLGVPITDCEEP